MASLAFGSGAAPLQPGHDDLVHDAAYDYYGQRLATCGSDHTTRIWEKDADGVWQETGRCKGGHKGTVWRVSWAHPEFGSVLATCSYDHKVAIWEQGGKKRSKSGSDAWASVAAMSDSTASVTDVRFAPRQHGLDLTLAACSEDGIVRVYEAADVMNLANWSQVTEVNIKMAEDSKCTCLSWSTSRRFPPYIAVGCKRNSAHALQLWRFNGTKPASFMLSQSLQADVADVAFAPTMGRSTMLLAVGCTDGALYLFRVSVKDAESAPELTRVVGGKKAHDGPLCRVAWNATGTVLATSGMDGQVLLWKAKFDGDWAPVPANH